MLAGWRRIGDGGGIVIDDRPLGDLHCSESSRPVDDEPDTDADVGETVAARPDAACT